MRRQSSAFFLGLIVLVAILGAFFVYPKGLGAKWLPWHLGLDLVGGSHLVYQVDLSQVAATDKDSVLNGLRDVIERRVNLFGVAEPQVYVANAGNQSQLVVELAGIQDVKQAINQIGETPLLDFREVVQAPGAATGTLQGTSSTQFIPTGLTGRYVTGAQVTFDQTTQQPQVAITFNSEGAKLFSDITGRNVGKPLAIFLDNQLIEMPTVENQITGGSALITGRFSIDQARTLVSRFNAGALPAPITLIDQLTVSPTLGMNSLQKAIYAGIIGTILVMLFMLVYYRRFGIFAALALIIYIIFTLAVFKLFAVTMTLAGLAGFILTIGMAVDANILIFERIKEETKKGLSKAAALNEGFHRAWPSIRDSNTSTIITAFILYFFTSSFIRGFALTLLIGVIVSLFSAITTTRLFLRTFTKEA